MDAGLSEADLEGTAVKPPFLTLVRSLTNGLAAVSTHVPPGKRARRFSCCASCRFPFIQRLKGRLRAPPDTHAAESPEQFRAAATEVRKAAGGAGGAGGGRVERAMVKLMTSLDSTSPLTTARMDLLDNLVAYLQVPPARLCVAGGPLRCPTEQ
jgi:hypothetical protein